jgi:photosystem II stability/assembly factor-like uncharacterized protein
MKHKTHLLLRTTLTTTILILFTQFCYAQDFWIELDRPTGGMVFSLAVNSITEVYAGMGNGVYLSNDDSSIWILTGLEGITSYSLHIHQNGNLFAGTGGSHNIYRLNNLDEGWNPIFSGSANIISITSNSLGDIFAGSGHDDGLLRSNNNGDDWEQLLTLSSSEQTNAIISLSTNMVFIGTTDFMGGGGVYRSADNGDTWTHAGLPNKYISSLAVNSQGDIFAGSVGDHYLYYGGLYKSTDNGGTWVELRNDVLVTSIVITPDDHIYFGSNEYGDQAGVFFSNDHGETWERIISGLIGPSNQKIEGLSLAPDGYLYAYGNHLHRSAEPVYPAVYNVSATANPPEGGTVDGVGDYTQGQTATLTAIPNEGYEFVNWTDTLGAVLSTDTAYSFTVLGSIELVANFQLINSVTSSYGTGITLYPNPTSGFVMVNFQQVKAYSNVVFEVFSIHGPKLLSKPINLEQSTVNISSLPSGMYLYRFTADGLTIKTGKFINH